MKKTALLSVYDKTGIVEFGQALVNLGWQLYSSGGTAEALTTAGVPVTDVADLVGGEAILGHRVVTLSREVHAGLLAKLIDKDLIELEKLGVPFIDLVCVDLYPLAEEIAKPDATSESVIEKTDIGGPTMLRSGAKGRRIVICLPEQRQRVIDWLKAGEPDAQDHRNRLAAKAEMVVSGYCLDSARYTSDGRYDGFLGKRVLECKYGENGWQTPAALFSTGTEDPLALDRFEVVAGTAPSYNNLAEIDRQLQTITHIAAGFELNFHQVPYIAIGTKHGNPCGAAAGDNLAEVIQKMVMGDPRAIFGGLVMTNFQIGKGQAEHLLSDGVESGRRLLDGISAPSFTDEAIELLERKGGKCRLLVNPALGQLGLHSIDTAPRHRYVRGGFLMQPNYSYVINLNDEELLTTGEFMTTTMGQAADVVLAWAVGSTSNSNTITLVKRRQLIGNGVGQQDRVGCCELAIKRARDAGHDVEGAVAYSDSFFPFPDGPQVLIDAGVKAIWSTTGSVRDKDTQELCTRRGVTLYQVPDSKGRGFFGH